MTPFVSNRGFERVIFRRPIEAFMARIVETAPPLIHIVDLQGARDGALRPGRRPAMRAVAGDIPLQVSGGIRSIEAARAALAAGASRVIVARGMGERRRARTLRTIIGRATARGPGRA